MLEVATGKELDLRAELRKEGLLAMVPTETLRKRIKIRHGQVEYRDYPKALIPGYTFVGHRKGEPLPRRWISEHKYVYGWLSFNDDGAPTPLVSADIDKLRRLAMDQTRVRGALSIGDRARLTSGPFQSIEGLLTAMMGRRVQVRLQVLGGSRDVWVQAKDVERAD